MSFSLVKIHVINEEIEMYLIMTFWYHFDLNMYKHYNNANWMNECFVLKPHYDQCENVKNVLRMVHVHVYAKCV